MHGTEQSHPMIRIDATTVPHRLGHQVFLQHAVWRVVVEGIVLSSFSEGVGVADTIPGFAVREAKGQTDPGVQKSILALRGHCLDGCTTSNHRDVNNTCPAACNLARTDSRRRLLPIADSGLRGYAPVAPGPEAKRAAGIGIGEAIVFSYFFEGVALFTLPGLTVASTMS